MTDAPRYSRVAGFEWITVTFDVTENVDAGSATAVLETSPVTPFGCGAYSATSPNYTCLYELLPAGSGEPLVDRRQFF